MARCPICQTPGAYVGFSAIECRNLDCAHFVFVEERVCPRCGEVGHLSDEECACATAVDAVGAALVSDQDADQASPSASWKFDPLGVLSSP